MAGYLGATPVPQATQHRESFTATSGQTTFASAGYTAGFVDVYLNGSHLSPADFTATNGSDVVLASGASADDVCDIISHSAFELNAQTFTGTTTLDGAVVINESSADVDFRVESNGNASMLFVDGGNNRVGIGTNSPAYTLDVSSTVQIRAGDSLRLQNAGGNAVATINCDGAGSNSDLKFTTASAEVMRIDNTGAVTKPLQPAFLAQPSSTQQPIAINSNVTVIFGTERFDVNADFASNVFTAPVAGKYQFNANVFFVDLDEDANYNEIQIVTTNRLYLAWMDPDIGTNPARTTIQVSVLADLDAGDTAFVRAAQSAGAAQAQIHSDSFFGGFLAC